MRINSEGWWSIFRTILKVVGGIWLGKHGADPEVIDIIIGGGLLSAGTYGSYKAHKGK